MRRAWRSEWIGEVDTARLKAARKWVPPWQIYQAGVDSALEERFRRWTVSRHRRSALRRRRYRESSQIQFTSQVLPPSGENDCSMRAAFGEMLSHM